MRPAARLCLGSRGGAGMESSQGCLPAGLGNEEELTHQWVGWWNSRMVSGGEGHRGRGTGPLGGEAAASEKGSGVG